MSEAITWVVVASGGTLPASSAIVPGVPGGSTLGILYALRLVDPAQPPLKITAVVSVVDTPSLTESIELSPGRRKSMLVGYLPPKYPPRPWPEPAPQPASMATFPPPVASDQCGRPIGRGATVVNVNGFSTALALPPLPPPPPQPQGADQQNYDMQIAIPQASAPDGTYTFSASFM